MTTQTIFIGKTNRASNYVQKLLEQLPADLAPGVSVADVLHDGWCGMPNGSDRCDCEPQVRISRVEAAAR